jgi:hypothetical protein
MFKSASDSDPAVLHQASELRGYLVSVDCGDEGFYQGEVCEVDPIKKEIHLGKATLCVLWVLLI